MQTNLPPSNTAQANATLQGHVSNNCPICDAGGCLIQVTAFRLQHGGWHQAVVTVCGLCAEEIARGNNPVYKLTRKLAA